MNPQDTDPLRAKGTDREPSTPGPDGEDLDAGWENVVIVFRPPYPGWSTPPGPLSRLAAWVRKWRRG